MSIADDARALVVRTTSAQSLPEKVADPAVLTKVAAIVLGAKGNAGPHHEAGVTTITTSTATTWKSGGRHDITP